MGLTVGIVGGGPAGLTLALLLERAGIDAIVLEARSRAYGEARVRAGLLEQNTIDVLRAVDVADRLDREGLSHGGLFLRFDGRNHHVDIVGLTGRRMMIYGQQEIVKDEIAAVVERGIPIHFEARALELADLETDRPRIRYAQGGAEHELACDVVVGCDGFHGVARASFPPATLRELDHVYPFSWLGILAQAPPATHENVYAWHERGFALHSLRTPSISRLYLQVDPETSLDEWPDERIWEELEVRLGDVNVGPLIEKSITPMRSFVASPLRRGRLFLAGDAAHIVPPTGAKGLNLAVNDVRLLARALVAFARSGDTAALDRYSDDALGRVWRAQEFSRSMTQLLHPIDGDTFGHEMQRAALRYLTSSEAAARSMAENYVGLPAQDRF